MLKKSVCLLLCVFMILPLFTACSKDGKEIELVAEGFSEYVIIAPGGTDNKSKAENKAALELYDAIRKKTDATLECKSDAQSGNSTEPEKAKEILVGATNRTASKNTLKELRAKDYVITYENERVIILGGSAEATAEAVKYFIDTYVNEAEKTVTVFSKRNDLVEYAYPVGHLSINGVPLQEYTIVYPKAAKDSTSSPLITYYTAIALADFLYENAGILLDVVPDSTASSDYELLIGNTSRPESKAVTGTTLADDEYLLMQSGSKIVMMGNSHMVAGAASALVNQHFKSQGVNVDIDATAIPTTAQGKTFTFEKATSAILMIGDGMGNNHINATLADNTLKDFVARDLPYQTFCTTSSQSVLNGKTTYTDSAAAATALATGYKTLNGYVGMDPSKTSRQNIREVAHAAGARTGVLTTDVITGATPAGFLCHHSKRSDESTLQKQINNLNKNGQIDYCLGSVSTLADNARNALNQLSADGSSYFLMIEEAHIDKRAHNANMQSMQDCVVRYNECIAYVIAFVMLHPYTALIITADHETGGLELINGEYVFTNQPDPTEEYWQHTDEKAPAFGIGDGVEELLKSDTVIDNTDIAKFVAAIYGNTKFGQ